MKKIVLSTILSVVFISTINAQTQQTATTSNNTKDVLLLKEPVFDFGKITQGKPVTHDFIVINNGTEPIKIDNVQASCGCTTPVWDKINPIAPGGSTKINVGFNAAAAGPFEKHVIIQYGGKTQNIIIKGDVKKTPDSSVPENEMIKLLNQ